MKKLVQENAKAITGLLTPLVAVVATKVGLDLPDGAAAGIAGAVTAVAVWLVPNTWGTG